MFRKKAPQTVVKDYENAKERDKGIQEMAKHGYIVISVTPYAGTLKKGKMLMTGGLGALTPGGLRRSERYTVTFQQQAQPQGKPCRRCGAVMAPDARFCGSCGQPLQ